MFYVNRVYTIVFIRKLFEDNVCGAYLDRWVQLSQDGEVCFQSVCEMLLYLVLQFCTALVRLKRFLVSFCKASVGSVGLVLVRFC